jgi:putative DNA-invertase from lambdoid prophage Rac
MDQKIFGYLRVSTEKQDLQLNKNEIICYCTNIIKKDASKILWIEETVTGTKHWKNRQLGKIVEEMKKDDIIITSEISRIGRKILDVIEFFSIISQKGVLFYTTKTDFKLDSSIQSQMMLFAYSLSAQIERDLLSERTKAGLGEAVRNGKKLGRRKGSICPKILDGKEAKIEKYLKDGMKKSAIAKKFDVTMGTLNRFMKANKDLEKYCTKRKKKIEVVEQINN